MTTNSDKKTIMDGLYLSRVKDRDWCAEDYGINYNDDIPSQLGWYYPINKLREARQIFKHQWAKQRSQHLDNIWEKIRNGVPAISPLDPASYSYNWTTGCRELACCDNGCVCLERFKPDGTLKEERGLKRPATTLYGDESENGFDLKSPLVELFDDSEHSSLIYPVNPSLAPPKKKPKKNAKKLLAIFCDRCCAFRNLSHHEYNYKSRIYDDMRSHLEKSNHVSASICYFTKTGNTLDVKLQEEKGYEQAAMKVTSIIQASAVTTDDRYLIACPECQGLFGNWYDVLMHQRSSHRQLEKFRYKAMPITMTSNIYLKSGNVCVKCNQLFRSAPALHQHWTKAAKDHHPMAQLKIEPSIMFMFTCPYCPKIFKCLWACEPHVLTYHSKQLKSNRIQSKFIIYNKLRNVVPVKVLHVRTNTELVDIPEWFCS
ncbi:uncharacterized protein LOC141914196 [Tubulanus polymorphus]|uniref:uncharacterized protein LOC141914196 n=1 Tax=Tubulanus polymorphus TaxID=672921 RepID=UPI003DA57D09